MLRIDIGVDPDSFDEKIRKPGLAWMKAEGINIDVPLPPKTEIPDYWRHCKDSLRNNAQGQCCYSGSFLRPSEITHIDHSLPKTLRPDLAYEWTNYRFSAHRINGKKGEKIVLDPAHIPEGAPAIFHLESVTGSVRVNPDLEILIPSLHRLATYSLSFEGLDLDSALYRDERMQAWFDYIGSSRGMPEILRLRTTNRFVWSEAQRQKLL
jgi:hypothetical protein